MIQHIALHENSPHGPGFQGYALARDRLVEMVGQKLRTLSPSGMKTLYGVLSANGNGLSHGILETLQSEVLIAWKAKLRFAAYSTEDTEALCDLFGFLPPGRDDADCLAILIAEKIAGLLKSATEVRTVVTECLPKLGARKDTEERDLQILKGALNRRQEILSATEILQALSLNDFLRAVKVADRTMVSSVRLVN